ncbi:MAG: hypothetical protein [Olavius algarvensis Gamma 1 endosymbiont]|nr:MAG: hypothetical protein [Olavius algarvensis Gamma 1 endosymbiont]
MKFINIRELSTGTSLLTDIGVGKSRRPVDFLLDFVESSTIRLDRAGNPPRSLAMSA